MRTLTPIRPRFARLWSLNPSSLSIRTLSPRAFSSSSSSSSSSSDYSNQSRGGLPRFFSELLPTSKGGIVHVQDDEFWHMTKVLRLRTNDRFSIIPRVKRKEERKRSFLKNGSMLLKDLIASCDGKSHPIRCYSAAELIRATNNFDPSCVIDRLHADTYRGILDDRTVIIKKYRHWVDLAIRDIIISMQMSTHKNSLKLLGCCLEFDVPALVFENAGKGGLNYDGSLVVDNELLPWKTRLRIAKQLASALTYLHTAFPRPIIHRGVSSCCILLDDDYVPKLFDFSFSITIPPGQLYVVDNFSTGTPGYMDSTYQVYCKSKEKTDVYSFGVLLLVFLMRREAAYWNEAGNVCEYITEDPKLNVSDGQIQIETIVDPKILEEVRGDEQAQQQLQDFLALALLCIQDESEGRPDMIDVAKELVRIDKSILP